MIVDATEQTARELVGELFQAVHVDPEFRAEGGTYEIHLTPEAIGRVLAVIQEESDGG